MPWGETSADYDLVDQKMPRMAAQLPFVSIVSFVSAFWVAAVHSMDRSIPDLSERLEKANQTKLPMAMPEGGVVDRFGTVVTIGTFVSLPLASLQTFAS